MFIIVLIRRSEDTRDYYIFFGLFVFLKQYKISLEDFVEDVFVETK